MTTSRIPALLGLAILLFLAGAAGYVLSQNQGSLFNAGPDEQAAEAEGEHSGGESAHALQREIKALKTELEKSRSRVRALEGKKPGDQKAGKSPDLPPKDLSEKLAWAKKGKGKSGKGWMGKGKGKGKIGLPEGMTREEQSARVRELVDAHDWTKSAKALQAMAEAEQSRRPISLSDKEALGPFFEMIGGLYEVGVDFFDARVSRRYVPSRLSAMTSGLDAQQSAQITSHIDQTAQQTENDPEPNPPLRYSQQKALDLQQTLDLEQQMVSILSAEQFQEYLSEVGDDPFNSGFGFKTQRLACTGSNAEAVSQEVARLWTLCYDLGADHASQVETAARQFVSRSLALPFANTAGDGTARRRALLERTKSALELQGNEEQELLAALPLSHEARLAAYRRTCPVLDLRVE